MDKNADVCHVPDNAISKLWAGRQQNTERVYWNKQTEGGTPKWVRLYNKIVKATLNWKQSGLLCWVTHVLSNILVTYSFINYWKYNYFFKLKQSYLYFQAIHASCVTTKQLKHWTKCKNWSKLEVSMMLHTKMVIPVHMSDKPVSQCWALCEQMFDYCLLHITKTYK